MKLKGYVKVRYKVTQFGPLKSQWGEKITINYKPRRPKIMTLPLQNQLWKKDDSLDTNGEIDMADLQRCADLKLSGHRREDLQSKANIFKKTQSQQSPTLKRHGCTTFDSNHNSSEELEEHIDTHYEDGDFSCDTCLFQSSKMKLLRNNILNSPGHSADQVQGEKRY